MTVRNLLVAFTLFAALPGPAIADRFETGDLVVMSPWARATPGQVRNGAAYMRIANNGHHADRLVSVRCGCAKMAQVHTVVMKDGVMKMMHFEGVDLPPGGTAEFKPGGYHVMLMGLIGPLREGETFALELTFEKAGALSIEVIVGKAGSMTPPTAPAGQR